MQGTLSRSDVSSQHTIHVCSRLLAFHRSRAISEAENSRTELVPTNGQFSQAIVAREISHGRFTIKTNRPGVKVSWQVTGDRHDAYADAFRLRRKNRCRSAESICIRNSLG
jgi:hypothetical protein